MHWRQLNNIFEKLLAEGEFDNLPGMGQPMDLEDYFNTPEDLRLGYKMLKENGFRPTEVELYGEIARLRKKLAEARKPEDREAAKKRLLEHETHLAIMQEKSRSRSRK